MKLIIVIVASTLIWACSTFSPGYRPSPSSWLGEVPSHDRHLRLEQTVVASGQSIRVCRHIKNVSDVEVVIRRFNVPGDTYGEVSTFFIDSAGEVLKDSFSMAHRSWSLPPPPASADDTSIYEVIRPDSHVETCVDLSLPRGVDEFGIVSRYNPSISESLIPHSLKRGRVVFSTASGALTSDICVFSMARAICRS